MRLVYVMLLSLILTMSIVVGDDVKSLNCIFIDGMCAEECPEGTHSYTPGCADTYTQRTCQNPEPENMGLICDLSRCDCHYPKVMDQKTGKCVALEECKNEEEENDNCDLAGDTTEE